MPLPTPKTSESKSDFVSRFMSNPTAKADFEDKKQRLAVAYKQWAKKHPDDAKAADFAANITKLCESCEKTCKLLRAAVAEHAEDASSDLLRTLTVCMDCCDDLCEQLNNGATYGASTCALSCEMCANVCEKEDLEELAAACRETASLARSFSAGDGSRALYCSTSKSAYSLNHDSLEKLKALIRAGKYTDSKKWSFTAKDSNELLGDPEDWNDYSKWFLGINHGAKESKDGYAYAYGKAGKADLAAIRAAESDATRAGDGAIAEAAAEVLEDAKKQDDDKVKAIAAACKDCDRSITMTGKLEIAARAGKEDGPPTFHVSAYTGGAMTLNGWKHPVVVDVDGVEGIDKNRPILRDHDQGQELGHTTDITAEDGMIDAEGVMSGEGPHVDRVVNSSRKGFPWQASIGAKVLKNQFVPEGKTAEANGQTFEGPINISRRTSLGEISFVALGADDNTSARIAATAAEGSTMNFEKWLEAMGLVLAELSDQQKTKLRAQFDSDQEIRAKKAEMEASDEEDDEDEEDEEEEEEREETEKKAKAALDRAQRNLINAKAAGDKKKISAAREKLSAAREKFNTASVKNVTAAAVQESRNYLMAERKRVSEVTAVLDKYKPRIDAKKFGEIEASAINDDWDKDKTELACLRVAREPQESGRIHASFGINVGDGSDATPTIIAAACARACNVGEKMAFAGLNDNQKEIAASKKVKAAVGSIYGMCATIAAMHGTRLPSSRMDGDVLSKMQVIERIAAERELDVRAEGNTGSSSTMSLSGITENILNKAMLESYQTIDSIVSDIAYESDTNDFKPYKRYRMTAAGILQALGVAGELKAISLQDESYQNQVKTQGVILTIGRDIFINDDMGAITQAPTQLGRGAGLYREMMVIGTWLNAKNVVAPGASVGQTANNFNFYSTGAANYLSGASSALGINSVTSAVQKFREQTDANQMPIMLKPDRIVVPPALETTADTLFNGSNLVVGQLAQVAASGGTKVAQGTLTQPDINAHKGKYRPVVSAFLSATVGAKIAKLKGDAVLANYSNTSDTAWDLLTNPTGGFGVLQVGYLRGQRTPIIERGEAQFNTLGIAMRLYYDFGVALHDFRCGVHSDGV